MHDSGDYNVAEIAALFNISRPTVYRSLKRTAELPRRPVRDPHARNRNQGPGREPIVIGREAGFHASRDRYLPPNAVGEGLSACFVAT